MKTSVKFFFPLSICLTLCFVSTFSLAEGTKDATIINPVTVPSPIKGNPGITGTANVNVTYTVPVTVDGILSVKNIDQASKQPFQVTILCQPSGSYHYNCGSYTAPQNARLVIEQVGASFAPNDPTTRVASLSLTTTVSGQTVDHGIEPPAGNTFRGSFAVQNGSRLTKIYADAASMLYFQALINKESTPLTEKEITITLSGEQVVK